VKILLVEDAQSVAMILTSRLKSFGHQVLVAENGAVAVKSFRDFAPDLVLMDIEMPVMTRSASLKRHKSGPGRPLFS
jgi:CheY-like chemotaxis protein